MTTLFDVFESFKNRRKTAFVYRTGIRRFVYSYSDFYNLSLKMAEFLEKEKIYKGDRVIIWAPNSPWWAVVYWGIILRGAIVVPVDFMSGKEQAGEIKNLSRAKIIIQSQYKLDKFKNEIFIEDLKYILDKFNVPKNLPAVRFIDIAEIIYTSGTTGNPKGVMLTHKNLLTSILQVDKHISITASYNLLSVLPLSHMFEQMIGFLVPLYKGASIIYLKTLKPSALMAALKEEDIYVVVSVPRVLMALKNSIEIELNAKNLEILYFFKKILSFFVHKRIGKNFKFFVSGGSALDPDLFKFWKNLGLVVIEGYGLTETSPVLTANSLVSQIAGSVGKPLTGIEIKLENKEILAKGKNIFPGYWENKKASREAFTSGGWFKTGDEGEFDSRGNLYIKGRKKELIVTSAGLNVYPDEIERILNNIPGVKESCVIGIDNGEGEEVHAVLLLENKNFNPENIIQKANEKLDPTRQITSFTVLQENDFPKTSTLKIQKFKVKEFLLAKNSNKQKITNDKLIYIIGKVSGRGIDEIKEKSLLLSDLGITSIGRLELVNYLEQEFRLDLEDTAISQYTTVGDLRKTVEKREKHDIPLRLPFYPNKSWARFIRETMHSILHKRLFGYLINVTDTKGLENLEKVKFPVIFITNHISYMDYMPIAMVMSRKIRERTEAAVREEFFFEGSFLARLIKRVVFEYITFFTPIFLLPQKRGFRKSLAFMGKLIDNNINILIFPEGERSWDGKLLPFQAGLGILVKELEVPVLPINVKGMERIFPRGAKSIKRGNAKVIFGKPIYFTTETPSEITAKCRNALLNL